MTPRTTALRPIRRTPTPSIPPGARRVLDALRPFRHQLRPGAAEVLAFASWADLHPVTDDRRLADEVAARLARPASARHLMVSPFDPRDSVGDPPAPASPPVVPLWSPPR
jgi:hypothetical protein